MIRPSASSNRAELAKSMAIIVTIFQIALKSIDAPGIRPAVIWSVNSARRSGATIVRTEPPAAHRVAMVAKIFAPRNSPPILC